MIILLLTIILSGFAFLVAITSIYVQSSIENGSICKCIVPVPIFIPLFASLGLFIGSISYYVFLSIEKKPKLDSLKKLLDEEEVKIVEEIQKGRNKQHLITKDTGLSRVKVFRIVKRLEEKGIVKRIKEKKVVRIEFSDEIKRNFRV